MDHGPALHRAHPKSRRVEVAEVKAFVPGPPHRPSGRVGEPPVAGRLEVNGGLVVAVAQDQVRRRLDVRAIGVALKALAGRLDRGRRRLQVQVVDPAPGLRNDLAAVGIDQTDGVAAARVLDLNLLGRSVPAVDGRERAPRKSAGRADPGAGR